jgi:hypothetical protein
VTFGIRTRVQTWGSTFRVEIQGWLSRTGQRVADRMADLWDRVHDGVSSAVGWLYRPLYWYRDHYEHFEPLIIAVEIVLITYGLNVTYQQEIRKLDFQFKELIDWHFAYGHFYHFFEFTWEHSKDLGEFFIFVVLGISGISRLLISLRGQALGYPYKEIERVLHGRLDIDAVYARVKLAPWGSSPAGKNDTNALSNFASTIANRTSALLSLRTYHFRDNQWLSRDHDSLLDWFTLFPAALWRLVPEGKSDDEAPAHRLVNESGGYYSVIVPTTAASANHIRRGQKATDLAEIDPKIADAFANKPIVSDDSSAVEFLAYVQLHVPRYRREKVADELLFATSIQHVVFLLHGIYGAADGFRTKWNFVLFCEAANSRHGRLLERLGFVRLTQKAHERSDAPVRPGKSYAGFPLFELQVAHGQPVNDSDEADARKFINFIEELTISHWNPVDAAINETGKAEGPA